MKINRFYSSFTLQQAINITADIENIKRQANINIQKIENIDKYQKLYGVVHLTVHTKKCDSILYKFEQVNWNKLDSTIPKWSYPFIYEVALKNSKFGDTGRNPEMICARDFAEETVNKLRKEFI